MNSVKQFVWYRRQVWFFYVKSMSDAQKLLPKIVYVMNSAWFQASPAMQMRSVLFRDLKRRWFVILYRRFGITYRSKLQGSSSPRRWGWKVLLKRRSRITNPGCVRSQNSVDHLIFFFFLFASAQTDFEAQTGLETLWASHLWRFTSAHKLIL